MQKDFDKWNNLKKKLHYSHKIPSYEEREIWWCSIGVNVGHEEDGKNEFYQRPVLVIKKFNKNIFVGIPLTTKTKENMYYFKIAFRGREQSLLLSQLKIFDAHRLTDIMGKIPHKEFSKIRKVIKDMF